MNFKVYLIGMNDSPPTRLIKALWGCPSMVTHVESFQTLDLGHIQTWNPDAIILSGSRFYTGDPDAPTLPLEIFQLGIPILGICYGFQWMTRALGGRIKTLSRRVDVSRKLDLGSGQCHSYRFRHRDYVQRLPQGWIAEWTSRGQVWIAVHPKHKWMGIQFHPEFNKQSAEYFFDRWMKWITMSH